MATKTLNNMSTVRGFSYVIWVYSLGPMFDIDYGLVAFADASRIGVIRLYSTYTVGMLFFVL